MLRVFILAVATVSARRISTDFHDHYLAQPRTDFGSFGDGKFEDFSDRDAKHSRDVEDSGDKNVKTEFSSRSFGERHNPGNPEFHEYSSFNTHFKHHHFRHSSSGKDHNHDFGSQNSGFGSYMGQSESRNKGINEHRRKDTGSGHLNTDETRTHRIETLGHEFGSESVGSERRQHEFDRSIESHDHRSIGQDSGFQGSSHGFQSNFGSDHFGSHYFQGRSIDNDNHKNSNNKFNQNSNVHRIDQSFGLENSDRQTKFQGGRVEDHKHTDVNSQNDKNKEEFEIISAGKKRSLDKHNNKNVNIRTSDHDCEKQMESENKEILVRNDKVSYNHNTAAKTNTAIERRSNSDGTKNNNNRNNKKSGTNISTENQVMNNSRQNLPDANKNNRTNQGKEVEEDRWIWSGNEGDKKGVTTVTIDLDDRAAFNGDRCPTGKIKVGNICVDVD